MKKRLLIALLSLSVTVGGFSGVVLAAVTNSTTASKMMQDRVDDTDLLEDKLQKEATELAVRTEAEEKQTQREELAISEGEAVLTQEKTERDLGVESNDRYQLKTDVLAYISFDGASSDVGSVETGGEVSYKEGLYGNAAYFDGGANDWLKVLGKDGYNDILVGQNEVTISFFSKCEGGTWPVYAAPDTLKQKYLGENYVGLLDSGETLSMERYCDSRESAHSSVSSAIGYTKGEWKHVALVLRDSRSEIYIDGELKETVDSSYSIKNIFTSASHLYLGHANWENGEGYVGYIDEFSVYSRGLSQEEISVVSSKTESKMLDRELLFEASFDGAASDKGKINTIGSVSYREGKVGNAAYFDGNTANYLTLTEEEGSHNILAGKEEATISFYSKWEDGSIPFYMAGTENAQVSDSGNYIAITDDGKVSDWKHVALVLDGNNSKLYVDGALQSTEEMSNAMDTILAEKSYLYLGHANLGQGEAYTGYVDEFQIYS